MVHNRFESVALEFRRHCSGTLSLLRMPVPFAYFHILKILLLITLSIVGYALLELEREQYGLSLLMYAIICAVLIGMQAIAVAMSDPFGDDDTDFDIEVFIQQANDNAIAILLDEHVALHSSFPSQDLTNPLLNSEASRKARTWKESNDGYGLIDDRETPLNSTRIQGLASEHRVDTAPLLGNVREESDAPTVSPEVATVDTAAESSEALGLGMPPGSPMPKAGAYTTIAYPYAEDRRVKPPSSSPPSKKAGRSPPSGGSRVGSPSTRGRCASV